MSLLNQVLEFCKVISSAVGGTNTTTLYNLTGIGGFALDADGQVTGDDESDDGGEQAHEQECFQALGVIGRPLPPEGDLFTEALTARTGDGLVPFAFRDLRLHRAVNPSGSPTTPSEGQLMFVGYGGAFFDDDHQDVAADLQPDILEKPEAEQRTDGGRTLVVVVLVSDTKRKGGEDGAGFDALQALYPDVTHRERVHCPCVGGKRQGDHG